MVTINLWAVLVAAIVNVILGSIWFGPIFGKVWMNQVDMKDMSKEKMDASMKKGMVEGYIMMIVGSLIMAYVLANSLIFANSYLEMSGFWSGVTVGFANWIGFVLPVTIGVVAWEGKSLAYWAVTYSFYLLGMMVMGGILAVWM